MAVLALSAVPFVLPAWIFPTSIGLDARSLQHLAQIPGVLLLSRVVVDAARPAPSVGHRPTSLPRR